MMAVVLIAVIVVVGFVVFFQFKVRRDIDKINLNFRKDHETYEKYKDKQKQWEIEQALFDKIRKKRRVKMNRKQRRLMYKKYPAFRNVIKEQLGEAAQGLETAFKKKWQDFNEIQSKEEISRKILRDQLEFIKNEEKN